MRATVFGAVSQLICDKSGAISGESVRKLLSWMDVAKMMAAESSGFPR
jgi:hypothetical protein